MKNQKTKHNSNSKNKVNIIKKIGINDPAFQSNNTVMKYVNKKLNSYLDNKLNNISKTKSFNKFEIKIKSNKINNYKKISYNNSFTNLRHNHILISSSKPDN